MSCWPRRIASSARLRSWRRRDRAHIPSHVCLCSGSSPAQGTPAHQVSTEDAEADIIPANAGARAQNSPKPPTSPGDIAGRCTVLAVALVSVTASVPPVTTAAPRRTRRSPPRVLFLACAGSYSYACLLGVPAPWPTIDVGQGPVSRPGVSIATGLCRMSACPPIQSSQHAPATPCHPQNSRTISCRHAKTPAYRLANTGRPALHPRPRFARPRPLPGPPFRHKDDQ